MEVAAHWRDVAFLGEFFGLVHFDAALASKPRVVGVPIGGRVLEGRIVGVVRCVLGWVS